MSQVYKQLAASPPPPGFVETLTGNNTGFPVGPDASDNINVIGDALTATVVGNPGTNTLTISVLTGGFAWSDQAVTFNAASANGYFCTAALTVNLPASGALYQTIIVYVDTSSSVILQANTGQMIQVGDMISSSGGTATSTAQGSVLELVFRPGDTTWHTITSVGSGWTMA